LDFIAWVADPDGIELELMSPIPAELIKESLRSGKAVNMALNKK